MTTAATISQQGNCYEFDVLVLGSGLAGLFYCLELIKYNKHCRIALVSKVELQECNSHYAQGGIAAVMTSTDSIQNHIADTMRSGD